MAEPTSVTVTTIDDAAVVRGLLAPHEPEATPMASVVHSEGIGSHMRCRALHAGEAFAGMVVHRRRAAWRWESLVVLADVDNDDAARAAAHEVDAGPGFMMAGFASHCRPVAEHLERLEGSASMRDVLVVPPDFTWGPPDPEVEWARTEHIDGITALYWPAMGHGLPSRRAVRAAVTAAVANEELLVLTDDRQQVVAFGQLTLGSRYGHVAELTVHPDHRRAGLGMRICSLMAVKAEQNHIGGVAVFAETNAIPIPADLFHPDPWWLVRLTELQRFPGERIARRLLDRFRSKLPDEAFDEPIHRSGHESRGPDPTDALDRWRR